MKVTKRFKKEKICFNKYILKSYIIRFIYFHNKVAKISTYIYSNTRYLLKTIFFEWIELKCDE